jgi:DNA-binding NtrC family response regulator
LQVASPTNLRQMLFVDDEPSIRLTLPPILEEYGFQIHIADSVTSALKEISRHPFDVLLSDLNISEPHDGFSVVEAARAANPSCVAILLTGYPDFDSAVVAIDVVIDAFDCAVKVWIPSQQNRDAKRISRTRGLDHRKPITRFADIEVRKNHVEFVC